MEKKKESFTYGELDKVARDCADDVSMQRVMARVREARVGPFTVQDIIDAGNALSLGYAAAAVLEALRANRRLDAVHTRPLDDDYTITIGELRAGIKRITEPFAGRWVTKDNADDFGNQIIVNIRDHREPDWEAGDVVQDADGRFWKRTLVGNREHAWASFNSTLYASFSTPKRPLRKAGKDR